MARKALPDDAQAFNACMDVVTDRAAKLERLLDEHNRAVRAANELHGTAPRELTLQPKPRPKARRRASR